VRPAARFGDDLGVLAALADQVGIAIETARLVSENEARAEELARANQELAKAREKLEEALDHRTAQLTATRRDLKSARAVLRSHFGYEGLVGTSDAMRRVYALVDRIKDTDVPVLITGESGTGKEIIARAIHNAGPRGKKTFVGINCGAIPEHLLESELFGHVRGAFTGADRDRRGLFREATEGTILLDEIGEMPHKMQAGLLRVLQEKVIRPVGGSREEPVDTRVIAATHRDLAGMVASGTFREDLFYRLNVILVRVPPLRERLEDIPILIDHFLGIFAARYSRERRSVSRAALKLLMAQRWPGNVRQLENALLNAWVLSDGAELEPEDFESFEPSQRGGAVAARPSAPSVDRPSLTSPPTSLDQHRNEEKERILAALGSSNWNRVKAAELIGMPRRTFYRRLKEYGIQ
jgi:DNA-binding NtrC family response regulator